jgi:hypothetical protein
LTKKLEGPPSFLEGPTLIRYLNPLENAVEINDHIEAAVIHLSQFKETRYW